MATSPQPSTPLALLRSLLPFLLAIAFAFALQFGVKPLLNNDFYAKVILDVGTNIILAVSLTMVNGFTGQFSLGHAAFMLVGAYVAAMIVYYGSMLAWGDASMRGSMLSGMRLRPEAGLFRWGDLLFLSSLLCGGLVAALTGYLVGLPSLRLRGDYLAIVTLGFGEIVRVLIQAQTTEVLYVVEEVKAVPVYALPKYVGGALGFVGLPFYTNLFWVFAFAALTILVAWRLKSSTFGRAFLSIREDEVAAEAMGVNTTRYKVRAFVIAAFFAGVGGGLFAHTSGVQLNPGELGFLKSFDIIIMVVLGGLGSISGAAIAAVILSLLPEWLRDPGHVWYYGATVLLVSSTMLAIRERWRHMTVGFAIMLLVVASGFIMPSTRAIKAGFTIPVPVPGQRTPPHLEWWNIIVPLVVFAACAIVAWSQRLRVALVVVIVITALEAALGLAIYNGIDLSKYRMILYALALILMMILRPKGLLGVREIWDVSLWRDWLGFAPPNKEPARAA